MMIGASFCPDIIFVFHEVDYCDNNFVYPFYFKDRVFDLKKKYFKMYFYNILFPFITLLIAVEKFKKK